MSCESVARDLTLYLYGELTGEDEERVEAHVHVCEACRREMETQQRLHRALDARPVEIPAGLLAECRAGLAREMYRVQSVPAPRRRWTERLFGSWTGFPALTQPVGAMAMVLLGFFAARFTAWGPGQSAAPAASPEVVVSTIRSVQPDRLGRVHIALDETRRRTLSGSVEDPRIRELLLAASHDEVNPGLRVDSIDLLNSRPASAEVRRALLAALSGDTNAGVRLKALEGLRGSIAEADTRSALVRVLLTDDNPGVRVQAIDLLVQHPDDSLAGVLQHLVRKEQNNYVRLKCQTALEDMNASVGTF
jgi:hypothetical protein